MSQCSIMPNAPFVVSPAALVSGVGTLDKSQHSVGESSNLHCGFSCIRLFANSSKRLSEVCQRISEQGVVGFQVLDRCQFLADRTRKSAYLLNDSGLSPRDHSTFSFQSFQVEREFPPGLNQRIVVRQQASPSHEHIPVEFGVMKMNGLERLLHAHARSLI